LNFAQINFEKLGVQEFGDFAIEVIDPVEDYVIMLKEIFDFDLIKSFFKKNPSFKVLFDGLHGGWIIRLLTLHLPGLVIRNYVS
jgi:phosphoglucomutase